MYKYTQCLITKAVTVGVIMAWCVCRRSPIDLYTLIHEGIIMPEGE
jgi:hypothetical protein